MEMYSLTVLRPEVGNQFHWADIGDQLPPEGLPASGGGRHTLAYGLITPISAHKVMSPSFLCQTPPPAYKNICGGILGPHR